MSISQEKLIIQYIDNNKIITRTITASKPIRAVKALIRTGSRGITALELSNTWALRLADYVFNLRHQHGLDIITMREEHRNGWHARYVLKTKVTIIE